MHRYEMVLLLQQTKTTLWLSLSFSQHDNINGVLSATNYSRVFDGRIRLNRLIIFQQSLKMQATEAKETIGNKENAKMLFL